VIVFDEHVIYVIMHYVVYTHDNECITCRHMFAIFTSHSIYPFLNVDYNVVYYSCCLISPSSVICHTGTEHLLFIDSNTGACKVGYIFF